MTYLPHFFPSSKAMVDGCSMTMLQLENCRKSVGGFKIHREEFLAGCFYFVLHGKGEGKVWTLLHFQQLWASCHLPSSSVPSHDTVGVTHYPQDLLSHISLQRISVIKLKSTIRIKVSPIWGELIDIIRNSNAV